MGILSILNSWPLYAICGFIIAFVGLACVVFIVRAYRAGLAMGIDKSKMKTVIVSSATFTVLPSVGILLGVIALSGSLGLPWPWLRLSVIGALHYETQVAQAAAEQVGLSGLNANEMTVSAFTTIALLMSICIMWSLVLSLLFNKGYLKKIGMNNTELKQKSEKPGFADRAMSAMFIGLVCAYIGSYVGIYVSSGEWLSLAVVCVSAAAMAVFTYFEEKKKLAWIDNFSIAGSMLLGMASAVFFNFLI